MSLSDLDLVAQAMAPTEPGAQPTTNGTKIDQTQNSRANDTTTSTQSSTAQPDSSTNFDLSGLNDADHAALRPILDALKAASGVDGEKGGELDVEGILSQLEAADSVADSLEGRLDKLLAQLGELEEGAGPHVVADAPAKK